MKTIKEAILIVTRKDGYEHCKNTPVSYSWGIYNMVLRHFSHVWLFATLWTVAHQAPLSMGFFRQEY